MDNFKIEFTKHFLEQLKYRNRTSPLEITVELVEETIRNPDFIIEDTKPNREGRIKKIKGRCLKVVIEKESNKLKVITVFWDRTLRRRGLCK